MLAQTLYQARSKPHIEQIAEHEAEEAVEWTEKLGKLVFGRGLHKAAKDATARRSRFSSVMHGSRSIHFHDDDEAKEGSARAP